MRKVTLIGGISGFGAVYGSIILNTVVHGKIATMFKVKLGSLHQLECFHSREAKSPDPNGQMLNSHNDPNEVNGALPNSSNLPTVEPCFIELYSDLR